MSALSASLYKIQTLGNNELSENLSRLGVSAFQQNGLAKSVLTLLPEIAEGFTRVAKAEAFVVGRNLGLDDHTIRLLRRGKDEVLALVQAQRELGTASAHVATTAKELRTSWLDFFQIFHVESLESGEVVYKLFSFVLEQGTRVVNYLKENNLFSAFFYGFLGASAIVVALPILGILTAISVGLAKIIGIGLAVGAAIAGALKGYRDFMEWLPVFITQLSFAVSSIGDQFKHIGQLGSLLRTTLINAFEPVLQLMENIAGKIRAVRQGLISFLGIGNIGEEPTLAPASSGFNATLPIIPPNLIPNLYSGNRSATINVSTIEVDARGGDSAEIASGVGSALQEQLSTTVNNYDDGVDY